MALIFWVTGARHTGQRLNFAAHATQQQWCPQGTSVQLTAESKHTWARNNIQLYIVGLRRKSKREYGVKRGGVQVKAAMGIGTRLASMYQYVLDSGSPKGEKKSTGF